MDHWTGFQEQLKDNVNNNDSLFQHYNKSVWLYWHFCLLLLILFVLEERRNLYMEAALYIYVFNDMSYSFSSRL